LRARIQQITNKRLDRAAATGRMDVIADLAVPLPICVICELLGFPPEDYPRIKKWSDDFAAFIGAVSVLERLTTQGDGILPVYGAGENSARRPQNLADVPVFFGGPVGNNQLMLAAFEWHKGEGLKLNQHSLNPDEAVVDLSGGAPPVRAFLGYAGWSAGQLEAEMKQKAWIVQKPSRSALSSSACRDFGSTYESARPRVSLLAAAPDDPCSIGDRFRMFLSCTGHSSLITC
jgi:hypothetical protein